MEYKDPNIYMYIYIINPINEFIICNNLYFYHEYDCEYDKCEKMAKAIKLTLQYSSPGHI